MKGFTRISIAALSCMVAAAPLAGEEVTTASTAVQTGSTDGCPPGSPRDQAALDDVYKKYSDPSDLAQLEAAERAVPCVKADGTALKTVPASGSSDKLTPSAAPPKAAEPLPPAAKPPRR